MPLVRFLREDTSVEVEPGTTLREAAKLAGLTPLHGLGKVLNCHGRGRCGQCRVVVTEGWRGLSAPTAGEFAAMRPPGDRKGLGDRGIRPADGERLACQAKVKGPVSIWTAPQDWPAPLPEPLPEPGQLELRDGPIALTGGTGLLGRAVLAELEQRGLACRVLVQPGTELPEGCAAEVVHGDLVEPGTLDLLVEGAAAVIHLAAAMGISDATVLEAVNVDGTEALLEAAAEAGVPRFVVTSSIAARRPGDGAYSASKWSQEDVVRRSGLDWVILQPVVMYGEGSQVRATLERLGSMPVVPVIGGDAPLRPLHPEDVAFICVEAALREGVGGRTYQLGGPDAVSFVELSQRMLEALGSEAKVLPLPPPLAMAMGAAMDALLPKPPLTLEGVRAVVSGTPVDPAPARELLGFAPRGLEEGLSR